MRPGGTILPTGHIGSLEQNKFFSSTQIQKVKSMQKQGTEVIRTQIQPSKSKREKNPKRTYG